MPCLGLCVPHYIYLLSDLTIDCRAGAMDDCNSIETHGRLSISGAMTGCAYVHTQDTLDAGVTFVKVRRPIPLMAGNLPIRQLIMNGKSDCFCTDMTVW